MASAEESFVAGMGRLSVGDGDDARRAGAAQWCLANWGCSLPLAYDLASEFFHDKFAVGSNHSISPVVARLTALSLQVHKGSSSSGATETSSAAPDDRRQTVPDDVASIWQTFGDMPKEAAMMEFIGSLNAVAEPALRSHVATRLSSGDFSGLQRGSGENAAASRLSQGILQDQGLQGTVTVDNAENVPAAGPEALTELSDTTAPETIVPSDLPQDGAIEEGALWTLKEIKEFKDTVRQESKLHGQASSVVKVGSGETLTVRVPTHKNGNSLLWEFATDSYDIAFGIYFEWNDSPPDDVQVVLSDSSDEDEDTELDAAAPGGTGTTDPERGRGNDKANYGPPVDEIIPIFRRNCHEEVHCGSHVFPGSGVYLLKFDNSYSLWRSKTLYYRVYCA